MADGRAYTGTPDTSLGNAVEVVFVTNASGNVVDRQVMVIGDATTLARTAVIATAASATTNDPAVVVTVSPNTATMKVAQGAAGASAWLISGPVTIANAITIAQAVTLATGAATIGQVQIAQPVTLATGAATIGAVQLVTGAAVIGVLATGAATIGAVTIATGAAVIGALATGAATIGTVALATSTATIGQVQVVTPTRTNIMLSFASVTGVTTEALATLQINKAGTLSSGTTYTVTTGKTLRVQALVGHVVGTGASGNSTKLTVRNAAAVTVASAGYAVLFISNPNATAAIGEQLSMGIPDGLEFASATQVGVSQLGSGTAQTVNFSLVGYEY